MINFYKENASYEGALSLSAITVVVTNFLLATKDIIFTSTNIFGLPIVFDFLLQTLGLCIIVPFISAIIWLIGDKVVASHRKQWEKVNKETLESIALENELIEKELSSSPKLKVADNIHDILKIYSNLSDDEKEKVKFDILNASDSSKE